MATRARLTRLPASCGGSMTALNRVLAVISALAPLAVSACLDRAPATGADLAEVAVSGGGVTVDVVTTNAWSGGFNGAVRITNTASPSSITSFEVVFRLGGSASLSG